MALGNRRCQAAEMVIEPGKAEGCPRNAIAVPINGCSSSPTRVTKIKGQRYPLAGTQLLIEHGDQHEIRDTVDRS